ncbi:MmgE/PrpD family protein [Paraburkholderia tuberum]|uniref:2-methylcitrate dehydratase PrpD n=1 Tax=Paraburkholderia tuberum TaxID=157910 RepID=A0A1H1KHV7_9BURK|nr:MmgE/PrpD family protein [Paraburkholderia tuberum]SDR61627.1 2-methylcitrate dehydratase PrpD [Paraburkholderia tuberum]
MVALTQSLASYIHAPDFGPDEDQALSMAQQGVLDSIATLYAGSGEEVVRIVSSQFSTVDREDVRAAPTPFSGHHFKADEAAYVIGVAAHALDYDDVALSGHPSAVLMPAILSLCYSRNLGGLEALRAYVVGYEVWAELVARDKDQYHTKGWHPTSVFGTVAATSALAYLERLSMPQIQHALGIAASMASGLVANFGSMTKPWQVGRAASSAFSAVGLAKAGLTASTDVLEHPAGFLNAISPRGGVDLARPYIIGKPHIVEHGLSIKRYPVCYGSHRVIDGVLQLITAADIRPPEVVKVVATIGTGQASMLRNHAPMSALEAKFSLEFAVASAILAGNVGLAELTDDFVRRVDIQHLVTKTVTDLTSDPCPIDNAFSYKDRVVIYTENGRLHDSGDIRFARGHSKNPMSDTELRTKFLDSLSYYTSLNDTDPTYGERLYQKIVDLRSMKTIRDLWT